MKIRDGFLLRELADSFVVVPVGEAALDLRGMITLNQSGAFLWRCLQEEQTAQSLTEALLAEYDVDEATAANDVSRFTELLKTNGLLDAGNE